MAQAYGMLGPVADFCQTLPGFLFTVLAVVATWFAWYPLRRWHFRSIPGPFGLPLLGNLIQIATTDLTGFIQDTVRKYGPVSKFWFGARPWVVVAEPELVRKLASNPVRSPDLGSFMHVVTGENREIDQAGLLIARGEAWRRSRRAFESSIVNPASLAAHMPVIARCLDRFVPTLRARAASGQPLEAGDEMSRLVLGMVGEIAYGVDFSGPAADPGLPADSGATAAGAAAGAAGASAAAAAASSGLGSQLIASCRDVFRTMDLDKATGYLPLQLAFPGAIPAIRWLAHHLPDANQRRAMAARSAVAAVSRQLMQDWQQSKAAETAAAASVAAASAGGGGVIGCSFLSSMMEGRISAKSDKDRLSDIEVIAQSFSFLLGGFETTSAAISVALFLLAAHPAAAARLAAEVESLAGRELTAELLAELPYTEAVIKEAVRLHPGGTFLVREAREDLELGPGKVAPKGSVLCLATHAMHHDPAQWPEPEAFRPERFLAESAGALGPAHPAAYSPFGMGPRMCVGYKLSMMIAKAVLVTLFRDFRFELHEKQVLPLRLRTALTYGPADGVWLSVHSLRA